MSKEEKDVEKKVRELEEELRWLEAKFFRSGVDPKVRMKTLFRMQKQTHDFVIWFVRRDLERAEKAEKKCRE